MVIVHLRLWWKRNAAAFRCDWAAWREEAADRTIGWRECGARNSGELAPDREARDRIDEELRIWMGWSVEHLGTRARLDDAAGVHDCHMAGDGVDDREEQTAIDVV